MGSLDWDLYSVIYKFKPKTLTDVEFFATTVTLGATFLLIFYVLLGYNFTSNILLFSEEYSVILYMVIFPSLLSYYFWLKGIFEIGAEKTGQFIHLMPLFGVILAFLFLDEVFALYHLLGMLLIFIGIYLCLFIKRKTKKLKSLNGKIL